MSVKTKQDLVPVNIRLPEEDLQEYREMALEEGKSLSTWIRDILHMFAEIHRFEKP